MTIRELIASSNTETYQEWLDRLRRENEQEKVQEKKNRQ